ncbi:hypothetical protein BO70DRAFT_101280 [Aspergillus heteromorphus CBS 117.55]|uniref:Uncharacterized protein n=1 Tax=Aspergillus heteromorphus CBS 117.55 TaxID=1448321 RepID=A0A317VQB8_9EURO|nr:uncharacterized protein BO70DRAFT_101280 [Aspergillus heteromorphus CBS 117.55]PWY75098.1 hypothetical protein BO70DRAFT_101280 [Aspergillus heteromorphus CBS 117.55]
MDGERGRSQRSDEVVVVVFQREGRRGNSGGDQQSAQHDRRRNRTHKREKNALPQAHSNEGSGRGGID